MRCWLRSDKTQHQKATASLCFTGGVGGGGGGGGAAGHVPVGEDEKRQRMGTKEPPGPGKDADGIIQGVKRTERRGIIGVVGAYRRLLWKRWSHEFRSRTTSRSF